MKFMVLGCGMQGRACTYDMLKTPEVTEVLLADQSLEGLESARSWLASDRVRIEQVSATDTARVTELARGRDAMVSAVPYFLNPGLARAALAARTNYLDLGGNTDLVREELSLHDEAVAAGITIQPDVGLGPGMINTIAAHGIEMMDEVDEVLIRDGGLPLDPEPPMNYLLTFSEHGLINEYVENATAVRDFQCVEVPGLSEVETIDLPEPLGRCEAAHASGGLSTMAWTYAGRVRHMDNKLIRYPGHIAVINAMRAMGYFDPRKIRFGDGVEVSPRQMSTVLFRRHFERPGARDIVVIRVTVRGVRQAHKTEVVYTLMDRFDDASGLTAMARTTGFPASIVAHLMARGQMQPGAQPVEIGVPHELFFDEARKRGLDLHWEVRVS